jgi:acyl carrier protein
MSDVSDLALRDGVARVVRQILAERSIDRPISDDDDLRAVGLTSLDMVTLVLSVEAAFSLQRPETEITPANFRSISTIDALVSSLRR